MIIKKLAVPLINDKILLQAEHCYIATEAITEAGFDFIRSRIPAKCKIDIVTGLDGLTSPSVLNRIIRHYQGRISLTVFTRNVLHSNVYVFDLPYRKSVGFVGSGSLSMEGLKDQEELFWKVSDPKEIESLMSWFTGYFEFGMPLNETIIQEYELVYAGMKQRDIESRKEKQHVINITASGFHWDSIRFKNQYFKKEDFIVLSNSNAGQDNEIIQADRVRVLDKLMALNEAMKPDIKALKFFNVDVPKHLYSIHRQDHRNQKVISLWMNYVKINSNEGVLDERINDDSTMLQVGLRQMEVCVMVKVGSGKDIRGNFHKNMTVEEYRNSFLQLLSELGEGYFIEVAGYKRPVVSFQKAEALWEFTKPDEEVNYDMLIYKSYSPGDPALSAENIPVTISRDITKLTPIYKHFSL